MSQHTEKLENLILDILSIPNHKIKTQEQLAKKVNNHPDFSSVNQSTISKVFKKLAIDKDPQTQTYTLSTNTKKQLEVKYKRFLSSQIIDFLPQDDSLSDKNYLLIKTRVGYAEVVSTFLKELYSSEIFTIFTNADTLLIFTYPSIDNSALIKKIKKTGHEKSTNN